MSGRRIYIVSAAQSVGPDRVRRRERGSRSEDGVSAFGSR